MLATHAHPSGNPSGRGENQVGSTGFLVNARRHDGASPEHSPTVNSCRQVTACSAYVDGSDFPESEQTYWVRI